MNKIKIDIYIYIYSICSNRYTYRIYTSILFNVYSNWFGRMSSNTKHVHVSSFFLHVSAKVTLDQRLRAQHPVTKR